MAANDTYKGLDAATRMPPPRHIALVTPDNGNDLANVSRAIAFAGAGDIKVTTAEGEDVVLPSGAFAAGTWHPMEIARIWSTGTTATGIVMCW